MPGQQRRCPTASRCARAGRGTSAATARTRARRSPSRASIRRAASRCARRATPSTTSSTPTTSEQVERPVLRVEEQRDEHARHCASRPAVGFSSARWNARMPDDDEQDLERVHARLGRVADRVRIRDDQHHRDPRAGRGRRRAGRRTTVATDRADHEHARQRADRAVAGAEHAPSRSAAARSRAAARRRAAAPRGAAPSGRRAMLTVSASSSHRSERVQKKNTSPATQHRADRDRRSPRRGRRARARRRRRLARGRVGEHGHGVRR